MVIDSSIWLEIFLDGPLGEKCEREISKGSIFVPSLVHFEVYKCLRKKSNDHEALQAVGKLASYHCLELTQKISIAAADLSISLKLSMADSIVLAHAKHLKVSLLTLDYDFAEIAGAKVLR